LQTLGVVDFNDTLPPFGTVIFSCFKIDAWFTETTNLISLLDFVSAVLVAGVVVDGAVVVDVVGGMVVVVDVVVEEAGEDVGPIFIRRILYSEPCSRPPAIRFIPFDNGAISVKYVSWLGNGSRIPLIPKFASTAPDNEMRATPEKFEDRY
jgi:hypothetical protein